MKVAEPHTVTWTDRADRTYGSKSFVSIREAFLAAFLDRPAKATCFRIESARGVVWVERPSKKVAH